MRQTPKFADASRFDGAIRSYNRMGGSLIRNLFLRRFSSTLSLVVRERVRFRRSHVALLCRYVLLVCGYHAIALTAEETRKVSIVEEKTPGMSKMAVSSALWG